MAQHPTDAPTQSRETLYAILGALVASVILATLFAGNPFSAVGRAYTDYSREPRQGPTASDTHAPANNGATQAK